MGVSGQVGFHALLTHTPLDPDYAVAAFPLNFSSNWDITSGVGANQADEVWFDTRTLTTGANEDLDFSGTTLQNAFGVNIAFVKVNGIFVLALSTNTTNLTVGNAAATQFLAGFGGATHTWILKPGDWIAVATPAAAGWAVGAGATDLFRITNAAGASASYKIAVIGRRS